MRRVLVLLFLSAVSLYSGYLMQHKNGDLPASSWIMALIGFVFLVVALLLDWEE